MASAGALKGRVPPAPETLNVRRIRPALFPSPLRGNYEENGVRFRRDSERVLIRATFDLAKGGAAQQVGFERAGPRELVAYRDGKCCAAIVTAGGLCPGLNDVVRGVTMCLWYHYGVHKIWGIRNGYGGICNQERPPIELTPKIVRDIHMMGGTILGSDRGNPPLEDMVEGLKQLGVDVLFAIGGDGTMRGAHAIFEEAQKRGASLAVIGIPKTIDNDIPWVDETFGFQTAVDIARNSLDTVHVEARAYPRCVGLVKLFGRDSGFLAASASVASNDVNVVLVPEMPFDLFGHHGVLHYIEERLNKRDHCVVVIAEGAGQDLFKESKGVDASGNKLHHDIGVALKQILLDHFKKTSKPASCKYVDPSYLVRSARANAADAVFCTRLAQTAVHSAMAGKTDMMVGRWVGRFTNVPLELIVKSGRKYIDTHGSLWRAVLESTGQPRFVLSDKPIIERRVSFFV